MANYLRILVGLVAVLITVETAQAQLDNQAYTQEEPGRRRSIMFLENPRHESKGRIASDSRDSTGQVLLSVGSFTFFKNNEYFNKIVEGYTLFGTQLQPQLAYYPVKGLRLEAGTFLAKDFGNRQLTVRPTFRATWTKGPQQFILGNIRPHLHHQYIEPLLNFERVMLRPLEEGLQYRLVSGRVFLDAWVDWQRQQYRYSNFQEEIAGGLSSRFRLTKPESTIRVAVPFQFTATHFGGQIDTLDKPLQTLFNESLGIEARMMLGNQHRAFRLNAYLLGFQDRSPSALLPYKSGTGYYLNGTLETRYADLMLSYFQGRKFIAPLGGDLYQSVSRSVSSPAYVEPDRRLVFARLMRDFRIDDSAALTVRIEPVYDLNAKLLDFSFGVYLNFRQEWLLGNVAQRVRVGQ